MNERDESLLTNDLDQGNLQVRSLSYIAGKSEVQNAIALINEKSNEVVSLHGGPGFEKSAIAIEVTEQLKENREILVIFSDLTTAKNVDEMIQRFCNDIGEKPELYHQHDDQKSPLVLWLESVKAKVIFVMDGIDNLLEENNRPDFHDILHSLAKAGNCQIITTSSLAYQIPDISIEQIHVKEMDDDACIELLRKQWPENDDEFLQRLASRCGNIPLAMSIAASQIDDFEDPYEFLHYLEESPYNTLERPESKLFVYRTINSSFARLDEEQKEVIVRLATVEGSFNEEAAHVIIEKEKRKTCNILQNLVGRNLIKRQSNYRYSIHLLIKLFLKDYQTGNHESAENAVAQAMRAEYLMVEYYLKLGHDLTIKSYSKDGYKPNREALKQDAHNIQNVLKICCKQDDPANSDIPECLAKSKIYTTSAGFFSLFVRTIIPANFVDEFLRRCAQLARERTQHALEIKFECLLVDQERSKTIEESDEMYILKMEEIIKDFDVYSDECTKDVSILVYYHYQYGRYLSRKAENLKREERKPLQIQARKQFEISLKLRCKPEKPTEIADKIFILLNLGNIWKKMFRIPKINRENALRAAQKYHEEAFQMSKTILGNHELTSTCLKYFGDLFLTTKHYKLAEEKFTLAKNMREYLGLQAGESYAFLLSNLGICLTKDGRPEEALDFLGKARELTEDLAGIDKLNYCKAKVYANLALTYHSIEEFSKDAIKYAKKAMKFKNISKVLGHDYEMLQKLSSHDAENH
ncbi:uncharacterized protein LOC114534593 [Dendronephthya gigantea]|uniref:uncharacterized protein LOC114534593 n=1 Tax=Dendronephthya gigantea TaxID=151771 RepID=UPI00106C3EEA|nr:uncharacterized protein LOC114534593 [Dendronephthya gigantea]